MSVCKRRSLLLDVSCMSQGSVAEWSKALVLGTSLFGGVGSNPTAAKIVFLKVVINTLRIFISNSWFLSKAWSTLDFTLDFLSKFFLMLERVLEKFQMCRTVD